jgi:uncharacterized protein YdeI (BOF family)
MKKNLILTAIALTSTVGFAAGTGTSATDSSALAKAKIRKAITITKTADLDFAGIVISGSGTSDTAIVNANTGVITTTATGVIVGTFNTSSAAKFTVGGTKNATYAVTLPGAAVILTGSNTGTLNATAFTFNSTTGGGTPALNSSGTDVLGVGATLTIPAATIDGDYTSAGFTVTVAYN